MPSNYGAEEDSWEPLGLQAYQSSQSWGKSALNTHWKDWCWSGNSSILVIWYEQPTHWRSPWYWEKLRGRRRGLQRMTSLVSVTNAMDMNLGKLQEMVRNSEVWHVAIHGVAKSRTQLGDWTTTTTRSKIAGSYGRCIFNSLSNCQIVFQSGCMILHFSNVYQSLDSF